MMISGEMALFLRVMRSFCRSGKKFMAKALMQGEKYRHRKRHEQKKKKCPLHWVIACTQSYEAFVKSARND